ncbi:MAG: 1,4-dihydroxy-2-naphthoate polyprenyltransferase [Bernardetiaceae bacterium]|nr:1,4-dihydroxy-2-naphthoate polyprenyltransferase [Bernardetiaceae bacterium]
MVDLRNLKAWIEAARLRTLPLALASIIVGSLLAGDAFRLEVLLLSVLTATLLQILSNFANDYGDTQHGADSREREGPSRAVQSGLISPKAMWRMILIFGVLSFVSGLILLYVAFGMANWSHWLVFLGLGIASIFAAVLYTMGKRPYGYMGLGDISVFLFFGWIGVGGTNFLHGLLWDSALMLPATSCGLLAVAVLNLNNIRDIESDKKAGKNSIPVRLGRVRAMYYHWILLLVAISASVIYVFRQPWQWQELLFLFVLPLLFINGRAVWQKRSAAALDPYLKQMAISALLFALLLGLGHWV